MKSVRYILILMLLITESSFCQMTWNQACSFNGTTGYIAVPHSVSLNITASFTIDAWVKPSNVSSSQIILQKRAAGANGYTLYLTSGRVSIRTNSSTRLTGKTIIPVNQWTHIAGSYESTSDLFSIYINGILDTSVVIAAAEPVANSDSLLIGAGFNNPFNGVMDEVKIWNASLSETDVKQTMRLSLGTNTGYYTNLVMSMTFQNSNPAGTLFSLNDWTGNNNNGINRE